MLLDWEPFAIYTESGTLLLVSTMRAISLDFDGYAQTERGIEMPRGQKLYLAPWKAILGKLNMGLEDKRAILSALEKDLLHWAEEQSKKGMIGSPSISEAELRETNKKLHEIFRGFGNEIPIDSVAAFYLSTFPNDDKNLDTIRDLIRSVAKHPTNSQVFSIGLGGAPGEEEESPTEDVYVEEEEEEAPVETAPRRLGLPKKKAAGFRR